MIRTSGSEATGSAGLDADFNDDADSMRTSTTITEEEAARRAWLARLDSPTWDVAAAAMVDVAVQASEVVELTEACDSGDNVACDTLDNEEDAKLAWLAKLDAPAWGAAAAAVAAVAAEVEAESAMSAEEIAKQESLARLDGSTWGQAEAAMAEVAKQASAVALLTDACNSGHEVACDKLTSEDEAKRAWLGKLDVPSWGAAAAAVSAVASEVAMATTADDDVEVVSAVVSEAAAATAISTAVDVVPAAVPSTASSSTMNEEDAKRAWMTKLDAPTWGGAAAAMVDVAVQASEVVALTEACDSGDNVACDTLDNEEDAKLAWLAKLDAPAWGAAAAAVAAVAAEVEAESAMSAEEIAKHQWSARLETPSGNDGGAGVTSDDAFSWLEEQVAKRAWLTRLDEPTWGQAAEAMAEVAMQATEVAALADACDSGDNVACDTLDNEEDAKLAWLAKLDAPAWGAAAAAVSAVAWEIATEIATPTTMAAADDDTAAAADGDIAAADAVATEDARVTEEGAKRAWMTKLDAPTWGGAAAAMVDVAVQASEVVALTEACDSGDNVACDTLDNEEDAKLAWLAKLDAPAWGAAAAAVAAVAAEVEAESAMSAEEIAKQESLARLDGSTWGQAEAAMAEVAKQASAVALLTDACNSGHEVACDKLTSEDEAKRAWLGKLDVPSWGAAAAAVSAVASTTETATTGASAGAMRTVAAAALPSTAPSSTMTEGDAKHAWLARQDAPREGEASEVAVTEACDSGDNVPIDTLSNGEDDKLFSEWLARLDAA